MRRYLFAILIIVVTANSFAEDWRDWSRWQNDGRHEGRHDELKVFDGNGKLVGPLETENGESGVFLTVNGVVTFAAISQWTNGNANTPYLPSKFQWSTIDGAWFASSDCTGTPFVDYLHSGPRPSVVVRQGSETILYVASDTNTALTAVVSLQDFS